MKVAGLERDLKLCNKICSAMSVKSLPDIGTDTGTGTNQLIGQNGFLLFPFYLITYFYDS